MIIVKLPLMLMLFSAVARSQAAGNKKNHVLEQEILSLKENLTSAWEVINELKNQLDNLESEERLHHHHHHYHHYYHDNFTDDLNHTDEVDHNHIFEHQFSYQDDAIQQQELLKGNHHHHHHHVHHNHSPSEGNTFLVDTNNGDFVHHGNDRNNKNGNPHHNSNHNHNGNNHNGNGNHNHNHENHNGHNNNHNGNNHQNGNGNSWKPIHDDKDEDIIAQATCQIRPNRALPLNERQNLRGIANFKQKGTVLEIDLTVRGFLITPEHAHPDHSGRNLEPSHVHGLHIHEFGDLSNGCESAGNHYNPLGETHGGPDSPKRHIGDLGNIKCDENGKVDTKIVDRIAALNGTHSIIGKTLVIHENIDDLGLTPDDDRSLVDGNAGRRLACCVITKLDDSR